MKLRSLIPGFLKPILRPAVYGFGKLMKRQESREDLHRYWRQPPDRGNFPESYLEGSARSAWLAQRVSQYLGNDAAILEIGCNVGRNLNHLFTSGFRNLAAVEISENAVRALRQTFPDLARVARIECGAVEDKIKTFPDGSFDLVFTMAVLEHIHEDSRWIFADMVRVTRNLLITVEDEREFSERHFPRRYDRIFGSLGLKQIEAQPCTDVEGLGAGFWLRVFRK